MQLACRADVAPFCELEEANLALIDTPPALLLLILGASRPQASACRANGIHGLRTT